MQRLPFTEEQNMFRESAREFFKREIGPHRERWREAGRWPQRRTGSADPGAQAASAGGAVLVQAGHARALSASRLSGASCAPRPR